MFCCFLIKKLASSIHLSLSLSPSLPLPPSTFVLTLVQLLSFLSSSVARPASWPPAFVSPWPSSLPSFPECWPDVLEPLLTSPSLYTKKSNEASFTSFFPCLLLTIFIHIHWVRTSWLGLRIWINFPRAEFSRIISLFPLTLLGLSPGQMTQVKQRRDVTWNLTLAQFYNLQ